MWPNEIIDVEGFTTAGSSVIVIVNDVFNNKGLK